MTRRTHDYTGLFTRYDTDGDGVTDTATNGGELYESHLLTSLATLGDNPLLIADGSTMPAPAAPAAPATPPAPAAPGVQQAGINTRIAGVPLWSLAVVGVVGAAIIYAARR